MIVESIPRLKPYHYHITDTTSIAKTSIQSRLVCVENKDEITMYLANKFLQHAGANGTSLIVTCQNQVKSTHIDVEGLSNSQEEVDTKLILCCVNATANGTKSVKIYSLDADVIVLAIRQGPL